MEKIISALEAAAFLKDGMTLMYGGFLGVGSPQGIIDAILESGVRHLTLIGNDTCTADSGIGKLVAAGRVRKVIVSHIGTNKETVRMMNEGLLEVELVPQGTLVERIRCGGHGLGGVLTPTGIGTLVEEGKQKIEVEGRAYLLETPLRADVAILGGTVSDTKGNILYDKCQRNFNPFMAMAADLVIAEVEQVVPVGSLDPNHIHTPGLFVNYVVGGSKDD